MEKTNDMFPETGWVASTSFLWRWSDLEGKNNITQ